MRPDVVGGREGVSWVRASCSTEESGPHRLPCPLGHPQPSFPRTTPLHCPAPGVCREQSLPRAVASSYPCARSSDYPHFSEIDTRAPECGREDPHGPLSSPRVPLELEREGPVLCCNGSRPGWGAALGVRVRAPTPFPSRFQNHHLGKKCSPQMPASPSCDIFAFFISNEHVSNTVSISKHGKVCFDRSGASREAGRFNQPPL